MSVHLTQYRDGFKLGYSPITTTNDTTNNTGIEFGILRIAQGEQLKQIVAQETAWLLISGQVDIYIDNERVCLSRDSIFDESPSCVHLAKDHELQIIAKTDCEFAVSSVENNKPFPTGVYYPENTSNEHRGQDSVGNTCYRLVRTIFDNNNSHSNVELVLGEVINLPGKWSSYPPHHHKQPEIYHYRFTHPQGFGHAELDDDVFKIKNYDTIKILDEKDHAQVSAPGYGMYYIWVIRHLENNRYTVPTFTEDHKWVMDKSANIWTPSNKN